MTRFCLRTGVFKVVVAVAVATSMWLAPGVSDAQSTRPLAGVEFEQWYLKLNGVTESAQASLYVHEIGNGPPVIVLHGGWGAEHSYLVPLLRPLSDRYRFIFYDQRGSLRSRCVECEFSVEAHLADLTALQASLQIERVTIIAHSMGTWLAMTYADRNPQAVKGLILLGSLPPVSNGDRYDQAARDAGFFDRPGIAEQIRLERLNSGSAERRASNEWRISFAGSNLYNVDRWRQISGGQAFFAANVAEATAPTMPQAWDYREALRRLPSGADVIMGDHDYVDFDQRFWRPVADALAPVVRHTVIEKAGHRGWMDEPEAFLSAISSALERMHPDQAAR